MRDILFLKLIKSRLFVSITISFILVIILTGFSMAGRAQQTTTIQDYLPGRFDSALFQIYFKSLEKLDGQEIEFLDLLALQPLDRQMFYGKKVYQEGFSASLALKLKEEVEEKERLLLLLIEEEAALPQPSLPTLPPMKLGERIFARMISVQKAIPTIGYSRFAMCGVDTFRTERVVKRVKNYFDWNKQWSKEGLEVEQLAEAAEKEGNIFLARSLFHEAAGCYHVGSFINFYDVAQRIESQDSVRRCYARAISLYEEQDRPVRVEIPFRGIHIPGYLMLANKPGAPLIIFVNVLNNAKEVENHFFARDFLKAGFNVFSFDGPGQGEMHRSMRLIPDYEQTIITIIDWLEMNNNFQIDMERIGVIGLSFGGLFSVTAAALDDRIDCVCSNGGYAYFPPLSHIRKLSILTKRAVYYMSGYSNMRELFDQFGHLDIKKFPPLKRPMFIVQGGKDKVVPPEHAYYFMDWATGKDKELLYIEDADHCCQDYFDIVTPYTIDWFRRHLLNL
jgi:esterase/lipase